MNPEKVFEIQLVLNVSKCAITIIDSRLSKFSQQIIVTRSDGLVGLLRISNVPLSLEFVILAELKMKVSRLAVLRREATAWQLFVEASNCDHEILRIDDKLGLDSNSPPIRFENVGGIEATSYRRNDKNMNEIYCLERSGRSGSTLSKRNSWPQSEIAASISLGGECDFASKVWILRLDDEYESHCFLAIGFRDATRLYWLKCGEFTDVSSIVPFIMDKSAIAVYSIPDSDCIAQICDTALVVMKFRIEGEYIECVNCKFLLISIYLGV